MKLITSIPPRKDGTVNVAGLDGKTYKFERNADGEMAGEIEHQPTVAFLLERGLFFPENAADYEEAIGLTEAVADEDLGDEDEGSGLPVEANTPPAPSRKAGRRHGAKAGE